MLSVFGTDRTGTAYPPHPTQARLLEWVADRVGRPDQDRIPVLYLQHGVRSGGTRAILNAVLGRMYHEPNLRVLIGRRDYNDLRKSVMETFFEIVPPADVVERDEQEHRYVLQGKYGRATVYFTGLKDIGGLGSQEFGCIAVHESQELTYQIYQRLKPRASQRGCSPMIFLEGNPPITGDWLDQLTDPKSRHFDADVTKVILSTHENWSNLDAGLRESLERMDNAWKRRYVLGESGFLPSGTPVYPSFAESVHVRDTNLIPDRPILRFWDFGLRRAACIWAQLEDTGRLLVHREWMALETPEEQFIDGVLMRSNEWFGPLVCKDYGDPAARTRDPHGVSTLQRLVAKGIQLQYRQTTYGQRIPLVNRKLSEMIQGSPAIIFNPLCLTLIEGLSGGYHYPELSEGQEFTTKRDLPVKEGWFEHLANAFEYGIVNVFGTGQGVMTEQRRIFHQHRRRVQRHAGAAVF
jgi:hypothetical protein